LDQIFDFMVRDFSTHALTLHNHPSSTESQMDLCRQMLRRPRVDADRFQHVWRNHVLTCHGRYAMRP
jgi:acyl-CoA dehydrogenase